MNETINKNRDEARVRKMERDEIKMERLATVERVRQEQQEDRDHLRSRIENEYQRCKELQE